MRYIFNLRTLVAVLLVSTALLFFKGTRLTKEKKELPPMGSKYIVFDFDGTICDSLKWAILAFEKVSDQMGYKKVPALELDQLRDLTMRQIIKQIEVPDDHLN